MLLIIYVETFCVATYVGISMTAQPLPKPTLPPTIETMAKMAATIYCILQTTTLLATIPLHIHHRNSVEGILYII